MSERSERRFSAAALAAALVLLGATPALAHEERAVGDLDMEAGWGTEPAFAGEVNSVQLLLSHGGKPIVDLGDTLDLEVMFGDLTTTLTLEPFFGEGEGTPGDYRAWFIPTRAGRYTFHFSGTIDGEDVDETFTSGPSTFDDVENPRSVEFPVQDPTTGELADRIDREVPRLTSSVDDVQASAQAAADDASSARTLGLVGLIVGAAGLVVAIVALVSSRRRKAA
ncbi:MAG: hypothetical protein WB297_00695 [Actinomycetota bacterium]